MSGANATSVPAAIGRPSTVSGSAYNAFPSRTGPSQSWINRSMSKPTSPVLSSARVRDRVRPLSGAPGRCPAGKGTFPAGHLPGAAARWVALAGRGRRREHGPGDAPYIVVVDDVGRHGVDQVSERAQPDALGDSGGGGRGYVDRRTELDHADRTQRADVGDAGQLARRRE